MKKLKQNLIDTIEENFNAIDHHLTIVKNTIDLALEDIVLDRLDKLCALKNKDVLELLKNYLSFSTEIYYIDAGVINIYLDGEWIREYFTDNWFHVRQDDGDFDKYSKKTVAKAKKHFEKLISSLTEFEDILNENSRIANDLYVKEL